MCVNESGGRTTGGREGGRGNASKTNTRADGFAAARSTQKIDFFPFLKNKKVFLSNEFQGDE